MKTTVNTKLERVYVVISPQAIQILSDKKVLLATEAPKSLKLRRARTLLKTAL